MAAQIASALQGETARTMIGFVLLIIALGMSMMPDTTWAHADSRYVFWIAVWSIAREMGTSIKLPGVLGSVIQPANSATVTDMAMTQRTVTESAPDKPNA